MALGFAEIEQALQRLHEVPKSRQSAFGKRLRNLQRVGAIKRPGVGGRRKNYDGGDLLRWAVAVELGQVGLTPERTAMLMATLPEGVVSHPTGFLVVWPGAGFLAASARAEAPKLATCSREAIAAHVADPDQGNFVAIDLEGLVVGLTRVMEGVHA